MTTDDPEPDGPPDEPLLSDRDALSGGFYELAVQLGPADDHRLQTALSTMAGAAKIDGPWQLTFGPSSHLERASWTIDDLDRGHLRGLVNPLGTTRTLCSVISVREDDGDDWLDLCLPLGALGRIETRVGAFPFGDDGGPESMTWRRAFDDWLAEVGRAVYRRVTFKIAVIGFEVSGTVTAESLAEGIPEDRGFAVLQPEDQLRYFPATR